MGHKSAIFTKTLPLTSFSLSNQAKRTVPVACQIKPKELSRGLKIKQFKKSRPRGLSSLLHIRNEVITVLLEQLLAVVHTILVNLPIYRIHQHSVLLVKANEQH